MPCREAGGVMHAFRMFLLASLFVALAGYVVYLLADKNHRRFRLHPSDDMLVIERGRFLPLGFEAYDPDEPLLKLAYAPILIPQGEALDVDQTFEDRNEIDRALYQRLSPWAKVRLLPSVVDPNQLALGIAYVKRLEILPSISEEMRAELRTTRADAAQRQAEGFVRGSTQALIKAHALIEQALELGCSEPGRAHKALAEIDRRLALLGPAGASSQKNEPSFDDGGAALNVLPLPPAKATSSVGDTPATNEALQHVGATSTPPAVTAPPVAR